MTPDFDEPWARDCALDGADLVRTRNGSIVYGRLAEADGNSYSFTPNSDQMDRIVACVNVCAGMDISDVEIAIREWWAKEDMR